VCELVFTHERVDYVIAGIYVKVTKDSQWKINGKNEVTLTPIAQRQE
jgi:hypothetical protein